MSKRGPKRTPAQIAAYKAAHYAAQKAKDRGVAFDLELSDIIIPTHCPVFGFELKHGERRFCDTSPSIDRLIPALGYTKGNIMVVSWKANRLKNNAALEDLQKLANFYTGLVPRALDPEPIIMV